MGRLLPRGLPGMWISRFLVWPQYGHSIGGPTMMVPKDLIESWREEAANFRRYEQEGLARAFERCATDLSLWYREWLLEELTLSEAAAHSGISYDTLQRSVASGQIPNRGRKHSPRLRRCDLPSKPPGPPVEVSETVDLADRIAQSKSRTSVATKQRCA